MSWAASCPRERRKPLLRAPASSGLSRSARPPIPPRLPPCMPCWRRRTRLSILTCWSSLRARAWNSPTAIPGFTTCSRCSTESGLTWDLYEAGTSRTVHFDREGISYIFCNIHPEMSAVVVVLPSSYFAIPNKQGEFSIAAVPAGRYMLHVWNENALPATLQALSREVQVSDASHSLGTIRVQVTMAASVPHKNKYGQDYEPPSPNNPVYVQP